MLDRDPLEFWVLAGSLELDERSIASQKYAHEALDELAEFLEDPPEKPKYDKLKAARMAWTRVPPDDLARAQSLYKAVAVRGGAGHSYVQESLLTMIALTEAPASAPFWLEILDIQRPRDTFAKRRRQIAMAALARMALNRNAPEAYATLRQAMRHANAEVREHAVYYLGRAYLNAKRKLPEEVVNELAELAITDPAFAPRFQARDILRRAGLPVPLDNPDGVYTFKVSLNHYKGFHRVIEMLAGHTLEDLHLAIQEALQWDNDHLYSFFLNNELYDHRYAFNCPFEEDALRCTEDGILGELGLVLGHKFLYFFDYGDSHEFEVEVTAIEPAKSRTGYPREVGGKGKLPKQYYWEDDDEDDDDE